jgi:hypothetical protein
LDILPYKALGHFPPITTISNVKCTKIGLVLRT